MASSGVSRGARGDRLDSGGLTASEIMVDGVAAGAPRGDALDEPAGTVPAAVWRHRTLTECWLSLRSPSSPTSLHLTSWVQLTTESLCLAWMRPRRQATRETAKANMASWIPRLCLPPDLEFLVFIPGNQ